VTRDQAMAEIRDAQREGRWADLRDADMRGASMRGATLRGADLRDATLRRAVLAGARLPAPQVVLLAYWGRVSDTLTTLLMRYDAASHPVGQRAFSAWAEGGPCPYADCRWQRAANFTEVRELWSPGPSRSPIRLAEMVLDECCPGWRDDTGESPEGE